MSKDHFGYRQPEAGSRFRALIIAALPAVAAAQDSAQRIVPPASQVRPAPAGTQTANLTTEELYKRVLPSIMTVVVDKPEGLSTGTAFLVFKDGLALTAWHLVKDGRRAVAKFSDGEEFEVSGLVDKDEKRDLALIRVKVFGRPPLALEGTEPAVGSTAYIVGSPKGLEFSISDGLTAGAEGIRPPRPDRLRSHMMADTPHDPPLAILEDALARCRQDDMRTPTVEAALRTLARGAAESWPFDQFRRALEIRRAEDRWQTANAALNAIRRLPTAGER